MRPLKQRLGNLWLRQTRRLSRPRAMADQNTDRIHVALKEPLCIAGTVLPPGKYLFWLLDPEADRSVVQVFDEDQARLVATFMSAADHRASLRGDCNQVVV